MQTQKRALLLYDLTLGMQFQGIGLKIVINIKWTILDNNFDEKTFNIKPRTNIFCCIYYTYLLFYRLIYFAIFI